MFSFKFIDIRRMGFRGGPSFSELSNSLLPKTASVWDRRARTSLFILTSQENLPGNCVLRKDVLPNQSLL